MKTFSKTVRARNRRKSAYARLEKQLKTGTKNTKEGVKELTDKDVARINTEMVTLEERL